MIIHHTLNYTSKQDMSRKVNEFLKFLDHLFLNSRISKTLYSFRDDV